MKNLFHEFLDQKVKTHFKPNPIFFKNSAF